MRDSERDDRVNGQPEQADTRVPYVPEGTLRATIAQVGTDSNGGHMTTYKAERYDYTVQAWIGTDGRYLCCAHLPEHSCQCYGRLHAGELAGGAVPTINEWPESERRGYDRYAQEVAMLAYEQAEQARARCELVEEHEAIVRETEPGVRDALRRLVQVLARERHAVYGQPRLGEPELRRTWGEWLEEAGQESVQADDGLASCTEAERQAHDAWTDEAYAAEEIARMAEVENERISDL